MNKMGRSFFNRPTLIVAKELLGKYIHIIGETTYIGRIVETEAYIGAIDKASHSYPNKITERTQVMYGPPGHAYIYMIYGMYNCLNIVTEKEGVSAAVLIRAIEPILGKEAMARNRYNKNLSELTNKEYINLTNGPGKLCKALMLDRKDNGRDFSSEDFYVAEAMKEAAFEVITTKRVNIDYAEEAVDFPWRFYIKDNPFISKK